MIKYCPIISLYATRYYAFCCSALMTTFTSDIFISIWMFKVCIVQSSTLVHTKKKTCWPNLRSRKLPSLILVLAKAQCLATFAVFLFPVSFTLVGIAHEKNCNAFVNLWCHQPGFCKLQVDVINMVNDWAY